MRWHGKWNHTLNTFKDCQTEKELSSRKLVAKTSFYHPLCLIFATPFLSWWCIRCLWKLLHRYNWKSVTLMPCNYTVSLVSQNEPSALSMVPFIAVLMSLADNVGFSVVSSSLAWNLGQNRKYIWRKGASTGVWKFHYLLIDDLSSLIYYAEKMQIPLCFTFRDAFWIKKKLNWIWKRQAFDFFY